jgi:hypothetical protein
MRSFAYVLMFLIFGAALVAWWWFLASLSWRML